MEEYSGKSRKLTWPLLNPLNYSVQTEADSECSESVFVWPEDSDERIPIVFNLSLNEFVVLASAIDVGSDIAYGVDGLKVWWLWDRVLRCPMSICDAVLNCIQTNAAVRDELYAIIADGINNNEFVQNALEEFIPGNQFLNDYFESLAVRSVLPAETRQANLLKPSACDDGYLYSQAKEIVAALNEASILLMGVLEPTTSPMEYANLFIGAIPVVGGVINSAIITAAGVILHDYAQGLYTGQFDIIAQELRCEIYCKITETCTMSLDALVEYYIVRSGLVISPNPFEAFTQVVNFIASGSIDLSKIPEIVHLLILNSIRMNQTILGVNFGNFGVRILAAGDTDDPNHALCDPCNDCTEYDFTVSDHGFTPLIAGYAVYVSGEGWARGTGDNVGRCGIQGAVGNYASIQFQYNITADNPTSIAGLIEYPYPPYTELTGFVNTTGQTVFTLTYTSSTGGVAFDLGTIVSGSAGAPLPDAWRLQRITVCR